MSIGWEPNKSSVTRVDADTSTPPAKPPRKSRLRGKIQMQPIGEILNEVLWVSTFAQRGHQSEGEGTASAAATADFFLVVVVVLVVVPQGGTQAEYRPDNKMTE